MNGSSWLTPIDNKNHIVWPNIIFRHVIYGTVRSFDRLSCCLAVFHAVSIQSKNAIWKCHPPTRNSAVTVNLKLNFTIYRNVTDTSVSNISHVSRTRTQWTSANPQKRKMHNHNANRMQNTFFVSFNWDWFCCWDVVYLILQRRYIVGSLLCEMHADAHGKMHTQFGQHNNLHEKYLFDTTNFGSHGERARARVRPLHWPKLDFFPVDIFEIFQSQSDQTLVVLFRCRITA